MVAIRHRYSPGGSATGVGAMAILNMVEGNSEALVTGAKLTLTGDLGISSTKTGLIDSDLTARVEVTGGTTDKSKSIAVNAVISTNNVLGTTSAKLIDSTINSGDNVSVTAVPEPAEYAMLIAGLGVIGAVARRRKAA